MFSSRTLIVCADDDTENQGNPGVTKAAEAAGVVGGRLVVPDFNDLANLRGLTPCAYVVEDASGRATTAREVSTTASRSLFRKVSDIKAKPIHWLWPGRITQGKVSMIAGNPGLGKSLVTVDMAATVSMGGLWPVDRQCCEVGNVIILSAEDDPLDTIRPRLEAAGADLSKVYILDAVLDPPHYGR